MNDMLFEVCRIAATIIGLVIAYYVIPALKVMVDKYADETLKDFVSACVYAAQQTITSGSDKNQKKKALVMNQVEAWLKDHNVDMSAEQVEILIESAVLAMKTNTK